MKRRTVITDRLGCAVAGAGLLGLGLAAIGWSRGDLGGSTLSIGWLATAQTAPWWPLALGAVAILLITLGLAWLVAHRPGQSPGPVALPGSSVAGSFTVDLSSRQIVGSWTCCMVGSLKVAARSDGRRWARAVGAGGGHGPWRGPRPMGGEACPRAAFASVR